MKKVFLLTGFSYSHFHPINPSPAGFFTEEEAKAFCRDHSKGKMIYSYREAIIGDYKDQLKTQTKPKKRFGLGR